MNEATKKAIKAEIETRTYWRSVDEQEIDRLMYEIGRLKAHSLNLSKEIAELEEDLTASSK